MRGRSAAAALRTALALRRRRYDAVIDGFVLKSRVGSDRLVLLLATGAPHRVGLAGQEHDRAYTIAVPRPPDAAEMHHIDLLARLAAPFDSSRKRLTGDLRFPSRRPRGTPRTYSGRLPALARAGSVSWSTSPPAVIAPGTGRVERFIDLVRHVRSQSTCRRRPRDSLPADQDDLQRIAREAAVTAATPSLWESFALVASADVLVTPDTALTHAASAFGTPACVLSSAARKRGRPIARRAVA